MGGVEMASPKGMHLTFLALAVLCCFLIKGFTENVRCWIGGFETKSFWTSWKFLFAAWGALIAMFVGAAYIFGSSRQDREED